MVAEWDENKVKHWVAKGNRKDVFRVLLDRRAIDQNAFDAIRRYEEALDTSMGHNSPERRPDYIRASSDGAPGQNISQAMILASHRARWVRDRLSATDMRLLDTLRMNAPAHWRQIVQMVTGEVNDDAHAPASGRWPRTSATLWPHSTDCRRRQLDRPGEPWDKTPRSRSASEERLCFGGAFLIPATVPRGASRLSKSSLT